MSTHRILLTGLASAAVALAPAPAPALAKRGDVVKRATCSKGASVKLKLSPEDGRIEAELEVDQNRNGVRWKVTVRRNGRLAAAARATTRATSGSFTVLRLLPDGAGPDTVRARATSPSGEVCAIRATLR